MSRLVSPLQFSRSPPGSGESLQGRDRGQGCRHFTQARPSRGSRRAIAGCRRISDQLIEVNLAASFLGSTQVGSRYIATVARPFRIAGPSFELLLLYARFVGSPAVTIGRRAERCGASARDRLKLSDDVDGPAALGEQMQLIDEIASWRAQLNLREAVVDEELEAHLGSGILRRDRARSWPKVALSFGVGHN
jgi:hypothetical protein